jgi:hypothetical protein
VATFALSIELATCRVFWGLAPGSVQPAGVAGSDERLGALLALLASDSELRQLAIREGLLLPHPATASPPTTVNVIMTTIGRPNQDFTEAPSPSSVGTRQAGH